MEERRDPAISVVVSTYQRAHLVPRLVAALEAQRGVDGVEAVVVDNGSGDETWSTLEHLARESTIDLRPLRLDHNRGTSGGRNAGWRAARAPVVAFTDDDCVPQPDWASTLLAHFRAADVVQGQTLPHPAQAANNGPFSRTIRVSEADGLFHTCNIAYRRKLLERLGGFDEAFRLSGDDTDLGWRALEAGAVHVFEPEAVVWHDVRPSSFLVHLRSTPRWAGLVLAVRKHPTLRHKFHRRWFWKRSHPPALVALVGAVLALAPGVSPRGRAAATGLLLPYVRFRTATWPLQGRRRRRLAAIPFALVADLAEVAVLAAASARYRTVLL